MRRMLYTVAGILGVGILASVFVASISKDDTGPEIIIPPDTSFLSGEELDCDELLKSISAVDKKDGDVSDSLRIESVHLMNDGKTAKVVLVAMDKKYNVTKMTQEFPVIPKEAEEQDPEDNTKEEDDSQKDDSQKDDSKKDDSDGNSEGNNDQTSEGQNDQENQQSGEDENTQENMADIVEREIAALPEDAPQIRLNTYAVTLEEGERFSYYKYIDSIVDSEDGRQYLYEHIHIVNTIDQEESGEYKVSYYVIDSDGNHSNTAVLTVTIP